MSENVIRRDIVQIGFDIENTPLGDLRRTLDEIVNDIRIENPFEQLTRGAEEATTDSRRLARTDFGGLRNNLRSVDNRINEIARTVGKKALPALSALGRGAGMVMTGIATASAAAGAGIFKLVHMSSDLAESQNVVKETFKTSSEEILSWTNEVEKTFGVSRSLATNWVGSMGAMLKSSGLTEDSAGSMAKQLVGLTGDMSSFYNLDHDTAWEKIRSGIAGETEPLKQLGINMSVANLEAFMATKAAKDLGVAYGKSFQKLNQGEQTQLRYAYLMNVTKDAQGDFARTLEGSFSNQLRVAQMQLQSFGMNIGSIFMPAVTKGVTSLAEFGGKLNEVLGDGFQDGDIEKISALFGDFVGKIGESLEKNLPKIIKITNGIFTKIFESVVQLLPTVLPILLDGTVQLIKGIAGMLIDNKDTILAAIASIAAEIVRTLFQVVTGQLMSNDVFEGLKSSIQGVLGFTISAFSALRPVIFAAVAALVAFKAIMLVQNTILAVKNAMLAVMSIRQGIVTAVTHAQTIAQLAMNSAMWACPITWIIALIVALIVIIVLLIKNWDKVKATMLAVWNAVTTATKNAFNGIKTTIVNSFQTVIKFFTGLKDRMFKIGSDIFTGLLNGMKEKLTAITDWVKEVGGKVTGGLKKVFQIHSPSKVTTEIGEFVGKGLNVGFTNETKQSEKSVKDWGLNTVSGMERYTPENTQTTTTTASSSEVNNYSPQFNLTINGNNTDKGLEKQVKRWIKEATNEMFDSLERKNPRLQEV